LAAEALTREPRFRELAGRVRMRSLLRGLRAGVAVGVLGALVLTLAGKLFGVAVWPVAATVWVLAFTVGAVAVASLRQPDALAVARAADGLGLAERVSSALYAERQTSTVADLLAADARGALARLEPSTYRLLDNVPLWRALALGAVLLLVLLALPIPQIGRDAGSAEQAARIATAQQHVEALELQPPRDNAASVPLAQKTNEELRALRDALARSDSSADAARAVENSQRQLAQLPGADDYAWRRSLDATASALEAQHDDALIPLARALRDRDPQAADQALSDLSARLDQPGGMSDAERSHVRNALQSAANASAGSQPQLASELRRAATSSRLDSQALRDLLAQGAADARALDGLEATQADLSQLRATTLPPNATLVAATGTPTAFALVRGTPPPNATLVAVPVGSGPGAGAGSGSNGGGQSGGGQGVGPQGSGAGGGAGTGDTPSQGRPSSNDANGTGGSNAGQRVAPNASTPTTYDPVYAPSHLGGEGGPQVQPHGDPTGAGGAGVDLPQGPLSVGDVRPYDQVYSQYAQEARQSTSRQALPPNVQNMVDRYFGAIAPQDQAKQP
jgi:hypothetical protein